MPRGGACAFCTLPSDVREQALRQWHGGAGAVTLAKWLQAKGYPLATTSVSACLDRSKHHGARDGAAAPAAINDRLGRIADLLAKSNIDPADIGQVKAIKLSEWQGLTKGEDGEAQLHDMHGASIVLTPAWEEGPKWAPIDRGAPVVVRAKKAPPKVARELRTAVILPDVQIGYWRDIATGALTPFHDEDAIALALEVIRLNRPDLVVLLGDFLDLAPLSDKFTREASFALTVQPALDYAVELLGRIRALVPDADVVLLEGNHDRRMQLSVTNNNREAFGIKRGGSLPDDWPVFSVPFLLRLDELGVQYVGGYPAGEYWINDNLVCIHGRVVRSGNQSTAAAVIEDERVSIIFGHTHRIELKHKTRRVRSGAKMAQAVSPGCLCRLDGSVPSVKGATDVFGNPVPTVEDWQQGCAVVTYGEGDGPFSIEMVPIYPGRTTFFRGKVIAA